MFVNEVDPDITAINDVLAVLERNNQMKEAAAVFQKALDLGLIYGPKALNLDSDWEIDVSTLPALVAKYAVLNKLGTLRAKHRAGGGGDGGGLPPDLTIITGAARRGRFQATKEARLANSRRFAQEQVA
ncbi:unnamed protein product, partial [Heterosigma akashiwo]